MRAPITRHGNHRLHSRKRLSALVLLLAVLSLWDLRIELQLLADHFTLIALRNAVFSHPLAVVVLASLPTLQQWSRLSVAVVSSSDPSHP